MTPGVLLAVTLALGLVGAVLLLSRGTLSKLLLTPLPVVAAALSLGQQAALALSMRLAEYLLGAGVGFATAICAEWLSQRIDDQRPPDQADVAG